MTPDEHVLSLLESSEAAIIEKYRKNYSIEADKVVTKDMVKKHWALERALTKQLLSSSPANRAQVFDQAYSTLYLECFWLNDWSKTLSEQSLHLTFRYFTRLLGNSKTIYEVGSGKAALISYLASLGYHCVATEITRERRPNRSQCQGAKNLTWHCTDGVELSKYEPRDYFDAVISTQVIEHLHPDDLQNHMRNVLQVLKPGGIYVFNTPNRFQGPADLSQIFDFKEAMCMHLREYTYTELSDTLKWAGFEQVKAVYLAPMRLRRYLNISWSSILYLRITIGIERLIGRLSRHSRENIIKLLTISLVWRPDVFLIGTKPAQYPR